jgi:exodeoxyribonuclease VII small subunit
MAQKKDDTTTAKYHELAARLEEAVVKLQDPNVDVDAAVTYYEEAVELIEKLERCLEQAQNQVREITAKFTKDA